ncbi:bolA-like protein 3 [Anoplophora glabripennis]|uniref:bolA-like protein 3 n=1 Tax=Anoplophora glabripennis TaxID=217634 RepID=UPI0008757B08|nr:bolA-like protein 3 [Anoplophora glabripennis]
MYMLFKILNAKISQTVTTSLLSRNINPYILKPAYSQSRGPVTESEILGKLRQTFPQAKVISVEDTSGGCGAMFNISIETNEFKGLSIMKQHRMIYDTLKEQIQSIHGLHLETRAPK